MTRSDWLTLAAQVLAAAIVVALITAGGCAVYVLGSVVGP